MKASQEIYVIKCHDFTAHWGVTSLICNIDIFPDKFFHPVCSTHQMRKNVVFPDCYINCCKNFQSNSFPFYSINTKPIPDRNFHFTRHQNVFYFFHYSTRHWINSIQYNKLIKFPLNFFCTKCGLQLTIAICLFFPFKKVLTFEHSLFFFRIKTKIKVIHTNKQKQE